MTDEHGHFERGRWVRDPVILRYYRYRLLEEEEHATPQDAWDAAQWISDAGEGYPVCIQIGEERILIGEYGDAKYGDHDRGERILRDKYGVDLGEFTFWEPPPPQPPRPPEINRFETGELPLDEFVGWERGVKYAPVSWGSNRVVAIPTGFYGETVDGRKARINATEAETLARRLFESKHT